MNPSLHVERFLDQAQNRYTKSIFGQIRLGLRYYVEYLADLGLRDIHVPEEILDKFKTHLYRGRCHTPGTVGQYLRGVKDFYEYLKTKGIVQDNPLKGSKLETPPFKERYYTDNELFKSYLANWRKTYSSPNRVLEIIASWKKVRVILGKLSLRLQSLDRASLTRICQELDLYPSRTGTVLAKSGRGHILWRLKNILRWMVRNGYSKEDFTRGFTYQFQSPSGQRLIEKPPIHPCWEEYARKFFSDAQGRWRPSTIELGKRYLRGFWEYLTGLGLKEPHQITLEILESYRDKLYGLERLADATKYSRLAAVRYFMSWLERTGQILVNPVHRMSYPKGTRGLPTKLMSSHDVAILMSAPDTKSPFGLRDRALFEFMYSTGTRIGEAAGLKVEDIDFEHGLVRINNPKGGPEYQRVVPIGKIALEWVKRYLLEARDQFTGKPGYERCLFLSKNGGTLKASVVSSCMRSHAMKSGMRKLYSSHSWRVTCATAMLKNRADIRYVQEQLGHRSLESTKRYTRLFPMDLKKVHQKTHPREREARRLSRQPPEA